jgi:anti-sigma factor ChrR (cupin superfamily)
MQLTNDEIIIHAYTPDDGSESSAVKVVHRTGRESAMNNDTPSQVDNLRNALQQLCSMLNPNPDHIPPPELLPFDKVQINLPESAQRGEVTKISWDFPGSEWRFFVQSPKEVASNWYILADLELREED